MSYEATDAVLKFSRARGTERLVLLILATHANPETGEAWPSIATLAAEACMGGRQVQALVRRLEVSGEVVTVAGTGRKNTNTYRLTCLKRMQDCVKRVQDSTPFVNSKRVQDSVERVQDCVKRVQDSAERVFNPTPEPKEPYITKENPKNSGAQEPAAPALPIRAVKVPSKALEIPEILSTFPEFTEGWSGWLSYRRERKLTCTPATLTAQLAMLARQSDPAAVIAQSIEKGWAGLFELKHSPRNARMPKPSELDDQDWAGEAAAAEERRTRFLDSAGGWN